jgi:amino acid transporter
LIVLAYLLGGVCMYFTAQSYATMTEAIPTAGSVYGFARQSLGAFPGFIAGWMILLDYLLIPAFVYVLMAVALETLIPGVDRGVWIVLLVAVTTGVNWFGIAVTARANFIAVVLQVLVLLGFVALCVAALYGGKGNGALTLKPLFDASAFDAHKIFTAASICIMSFLGFDAVSTLAEEVEGGDRRVVGRAIIAVLILSAVFFVGITWVFGDLMPGVAIKDQSAAIYEMATWATGSWTAVVLAWSYATIVGLSNALPMQVGVARVVFAMGRDRQLPAVLARIHPTYRTPYVGMLVTAAISLAVALYMKNKFHRQFRRVERFSVSACIGAGALRHPAALAGLGRALAGAAMRHRGRAAGVFRHERAGHEGGFRLAGRRHWVRSRAQVAASGRVAGAPLTS